MCDQTEVIYAPGDVVWVKLGPVWWPSQVQDYDQLPDEITANLRKRPIAVVKFFQEDAFEYVKNIDQIYRYNCRRKYEFIKKGLDMYRSSNRTVPSNMKFFPNDIATAEHLTDGDPNILDDEQFQPEQKEDYSELFGKKSAKKSKIDQVKEWRVRSFGRDSPVSGARNGRRSLPVTTPRPVTHPRFINKALGKGSDHEVRIRSQNADMLRSLSSGKLYNCHLCGFSASRINVIILHNKSHTAGYADAFLPPLPSTGNKVKKRSMNEKRHKTSLAVDKSKTDEPPVKRKSLGGASAEEKSSSRSPSKSSQKESKVTADNAVASPSKAVPEAKASPSKKPLFGKRRSAKDKAEKAAREKLQTDAFRENLLKDWDDDDDKNDDEDNNKEENSLSVDQSTSNDKSSDVESTKDSPKKDDSKKSPSKEISCFDFDDSEDGIKPEETVMQFGRKIPRILGDKRKRKSESDKEDTKVVEETEEVFRVEDNATDEISNKVVDEEKAKEDFDLAFRALLNDTVAPTIPDDFATKKDIPKLITEEETVVSTSTTAEDLTPPDPCGEVDTVLTAIDDGVKTNEDVPNKNEHFLVQTSGEGATTSPDKDPSEIETAAFLDASGVASHSVEFSENTKETEKITSIVEQSTTVKENVIDFNVEEETLANNCAGLSKQSTVQVEKSPADGAKCQGFLSNDFVDDCIVDSYCEQISIRKSPSKINENTQGSSQPQVKKIEEPKKVSNNVDVDVVSQDEDMQYIVVTSTANESVSNSHVKEPQNVVTTLSEILQSQPAPSSTTATTTSSVNNMYQDMDFDIDSMPVIIGDDMVQEEEIQQDQGTVFQTVETTPAPKVQRSTRLLPFLSSKSSTKPAENKIVTVISSTGQISKMNQSEFNQVRLVAGNKKDQQIVQHMRIPTTKDNKITRKVLLTPTKTLSSSTQPTTVKISASSQVGKLSVPGLVTQKGIVQNATGSGQVLILKSTGPPGSAPKATLQKMPQVIHQAGGNKVLILTQGTPGQKVLTTLASPQNITGTRFLTTKGSVVVGKGGKACQKILIDKSGAISQSPKSVIIDKSGILTPVGSTLPKNSNALLTSCSSDSIASVGSKLTFAGNSKGTAILASPSISGGKNVILTPVASKSSVVQDNPKLRLIASKSNTPVSSNAGPKLVLSSPQSTRILVPSVATKNQQLKFITNTSKTQSNTSGTILIQTNQGVLATSSFAGATIQKQTKQGAKAQATLIPAAPKAAHILSAEQQPQKQLQQQLQTQNKKLAIPKKPASPNILQKTQRKPPQRALKKNFLTEQAATALTTQAVAAAAPAVGSSHTQDVLLLPSMKNMPVVSQGTILQGTTVDAEGRKSYVYLTVDEHGNYRPLETAPVLDFDATTSTSSEPVPELQQTTSSPPAPSIAPAAAPTQLPPQQTLYFDPGTTDLDNLLLAIDEAGNVVNITQQAPVGVSDSAAAGSSLPLERSGQDILAKALADTQVLQQEPIAPPDPVTSSMLGCVFVESLPPAPSLSHNVLETSSTLNQPPIMTPLEVPSAVSSLQSLPPMQSSFLKATDTIAHPSMPLLSEDSDMSTEAKADKTMFVASSSSSLIGQTSNSSLAFQLSIGADNNIIVSSSAAVNAPSSLAYVVPQASTSDTILSQTSSVEYVPADAVSQEVVAMEQTEIGDQVTGENGLIEQQVVSEESFPVQETVEFNIDDVETTETKVFTEECHPQTSGDLLDSTASIPASMALDFQESVTSDHSDSKTDFNAFNDMSTTLGAVTNYNLDATDSVNAPKTNSEETDGMTVVSTESQEEQFSVESPNKQR